MSLNDTLRARSDRDPSPPERRSWAGASRRLPASMRRYVLPLVACFALAALSLPLVPRTIGYDPWSWVIWGREIAHLGLNTRGAASSVKPLPMIFTTLFSLSGPASPWLWLVTARAGAGMALVLAYRLGARLGGRIAGLLALLALLLSVQFAGYLVLQGMAEPVGAAFALAAAEAHMDGRRKATMVCLVGLTLVRIEALPMVAAYGLWCILAPVWKTGARRLGAWLRGISWVSVVGLAVLGVAIVGAWFLPDLWGAGNLMRSAQSATHESQGGPLLSKVPGLATIAEARNMLPLPFTVAFVWRWVADMVALVRGRRTATWWLGSCAVAWVLIEAVMAQLGVATGAPRYLLPAGSALACVVAGCAWVQAVRWAMARWNRLRVAIPVGVTVCAVVAVGVGIGVGAVGMPLKYHRAVRAARAVRELAPFVQRNGGRAAALRCGPVATAPLRVPLLAWTLDVPVGSIDSTVSAHGTLFQLKRYPRVPRRYRHDYHFVGSMGPAGAKWVELTTCSGSPH